MSARFSTLDAWLQWQETLHPSVIDLGLSRIRQVAITLFGEDFQKQQPLTITVAGTNGKGADGHCELGNRRGAEKGRPCGCVHRNQSDWRSRGTSRNRSLKRQPRFDFAANKHVVSEGSFGKSGRR